MRIPAAVRRFADRASLSVLRVAMIGAGTLAVAACAVTATAYAKGYRVNLTPSMPVGVWQVAGDKAFARGDVVWACPPNIAPLREAHRFGYIPAGFCESGMAPLLKPVVAVAGDHVSVSDDGVRVNGELVPNSAPARRDAHGRFLPRFPKVSYVVKPDQVWLVSSYNPASFDSRYFGPVSASLVDGRARPVLIQADAR